MYKIGISEDNFYDKNRSPKELLALINRVKMVDYTVTVYTANLSSAGTFSNVFIKLFGTDAASERVRLINTEGALYLTSGDETVFSMSCPASLGKLLKIELDKVALPLFPKDLWLPDKVVVNSPEGDIYNFPIYRWIPNSVKPFSFREGRALRVIDEDDASRESRREELTQREKDYRWDEATIPHGLKAEDLLSLPCEVRFSLSVFKDFIDATFEGLSELQLKGLADLQTWSDFDAIHQVFSCKRSEAADYVQEHWKEDAFFGYQYLNGVNPVMIRRCSALPENFPVKDMPTGLFPLEGEMQKGNIFLCDYKRLDGLKPNTINGKEQYLMAPLVLLHKTPEDTLVPIAIQLKQTPADDNPIFYTTDSEYDWLTAKIFVRGADVIEHQINVYLLRTHMMAEVFAVSLLRNVPMVHPLHKLLVPHTHYTLQVNCLFRLLLLSKNGVLTQSAACSRDGMLELAKRSLPAVTYSSLCIPDDIKERGLEDVPNFYYRDDGLKLWDIINKFVQGVLSFYYKSDAEVQNDSELQKWILDIFEHGFLSKAETGIPQSFTTVAELVKFVTMVIFTCSGQHSAVTAGEYDYGGWMPNDPITLQRPPPTRRGTTNEATILETFPDVRTTVQGMVTMFLSSHQPADFIPLGQYPDDHFSEETPLKLIKDFQAELALLSTNINTRNKSLTLPYTYLDPAKVENSVSL